MLAVIFYVVHDLYFGRGVLAISAGVSAVGIIMARLALLSPFVEKALKTRILVVGTGSKANNILHLPLRMDLRSCQIVGFWRVDDEAQVIESAHVLKLDRTLADYATESEIDEIVVALEDRRKNLPIQDLMECRMRGIAVIDEMTFFERESGKVRLDMLKPSWIIFSNGFQVNAMRQNSKRLFDIIASVLLLMITWPIMVLTALAILIESNGKGPIFYQQSRVGQGGKPFQLLKFRSMCVDAEASGTPQWAKMNDMRVTFVGKIIRRFRIDELPQILNILSGEMSFIGPRPERPEFVSQLSGQINYYCERHRIKPGLSGWAQLCYPYGGSTEDAIEKLQYDLYYVKNHSLFMDLSILIQTAEVVFFGKGVR
jgi:sugar transferase (PEP-CTERM system associated)